MQAELHHARIEWKRGEAPFTYEKYDRAHRVRFGGGSEMALTAAERFRGRKEIPNPEELFAAALSSCHMLTFLALAARAGIVVNRYEDDASATLAVNADRKLAVTRVVLRPKVAFATPVSREQLDRLHQQSHEQCFIALATACEVAVEPRVGA